MNGDDLAFFCAVLLVALIGLIIGMHTKEQ
jgi:hypothetical protein